MIQITCKGNSASCTRTERLTSGMVGLQCEFVFDGAWDGLARTAVFWAGNEKRDVLLTGDTCTVPWEVLKTAGYQLVIGVYGSNAEGTLVIPTVYAMCGGIASGADPSGDESTDPTLPVWGQMQGMIGNLENLSTSSKDNLVAAINEAAKSGGGGGASVELDTTLTQSGKAADAKAVGDALDEKQQKGDYLTQNELQSATNAALAQAKESGEFDGADGITPSIGNNGNWYIGTTDTGKPSRGEKGDPGDTPDMTAYRTAEEQDAIDANKQNTLIQSGASVGQIAKITAVDDSGKPTAWEAVDMPSSGGGTKMEEVTETVTVGTENVVLDSTAPSQTVNLAWNVQGTKTIPPFTNYYSNLNGKTYPRELGGGYNQFWSSSAGHGNAVAFDSAHEYFMALKYELDGDSTAHFESSSTNYITPTNSMTLSGSGWIYAFGKIINEGAATWYINSLSGTGRVYYVYCIDVTALREAGMITATTINELAELFGGLELIPGQDYAGSVTSGMATLSITRDGETTTVDSGTATATVQGGDILSVEGGSVTFLLKVLREVYVDPVRVWEGRKWVAFGDSLTDETINADKKYYRYIEEKTGITVVVMGAGGTGYYKGYDSGMAYGQRMVNVPTDADVITIFGSVNDWHTKSANVAMGNASDTMEAGTLAGYINECIDVAIEKAPYAQIALVTPMDYNGLPDDTLEGIANIIKAVAAYRKIKCLDLYHESGFRVDNPTFAAVYTTDYSETDETYGHPSNLAHEQLIAPEFMELLKRMLLTA